MLYPNPRGSSSYGEKFGNIIQYRYPGDDYKDLMAGVDELERRGIARPEAAGRNGRQRRWAADRRTWTITQTDRFAAAVSQRSIADWSAWWYTADFTLFQPRWFQSPPFQKPEEYAARSPLTFIEKVKTPLLLIEGESDYRTPPAAGGEMMFRALKFLKKPVVMVISGESRTKAVAIGKALLVALNGLNISLTGSTSTCWAKPCRSMTSRPLRNESESGNDIWAGSTRRQASSAKRPPRASEQLDR